MGHLPAVRFRGSEGRQRTGIRLQREGVRTAGARDLCRRHRRGRCGTTGGAARRRQQDERQHGGRRHGHHDATSAAWRRAHRTHTLHMSVSPKAAVEAADARADQPEVGVLVQRDQRHVGLDLAGGAEVQRILPRRVGLGPRQREKAVHVPVAIRGPARVRRLRAVEERVEDRIGGRVVAHPPGHEQGRPAIARERCVHLLGVHRSQAQVDAGCGTGGSQPPGEAVVHADVRVHEGQRGAPGLLVQATGQGRVVRLWRRRVVPSRQQRRHEPGLGHRHALLHIGDHGVPVYAAVDVGRHRQAARAPTTGSCMSKPRKRVPNTGSRRTPHSPSFTCGSSRPPRPGRSAPRRSRRRHAGRRAGVS